MSEASRRGEEAVRRPGPVQDDGATGDALGRPELTDEEFAAAFGEPVSRVLDLDTWQPGLDLLGLYGRLEREVREAVRLEEETVGQVRRSRFPRIRERPGAPPGAGVYRAGVDEIARVHEGLLLRGAVEACQGISAVYHTLPISIVQVAVCLVSYQGDQGAWAQRLYRRDLRLESIATVDEALELLTRRQGAYAIAGQGRRDALSELGRRSIMAYAERAALLHRSHARWRLGHGAPVPLEMVSAAGVPGLVERGLEVLEELIFRQRRFLFVPSAGRRWLLTIGNALAPLEYAILDTISDDLAQVIAAGQYWGARRGLGARLREFALEAGPQVVVGLYRASALAPAQLFYAHREHAHLAALIALADSVFQPHRGFPMLLDLAALVCQSNFGAETLAAPVQLAYMGTEGPFRYLRAGAGGPSR